MLKDGDIIGEDTNPESLPVVATNLDSMGRAVKTLPIWLILRMEDMDIPGTIENDNKDAEAMEYIPIEDSCTPLDTDNDLDTLVNPLLNPVSLILTDSEIDTD